MIPISYIAVGIVLLATGFLVGVGRAHLIILGRTIFSFGEEWTPPPVLTALAPPVHYHVRVIVEDGDGHIESQNEWHFPSQQSAFVVAHQMEAIACQAAQGAMVEAVRRQ